MTGKRKASDDAPGTPRPPAPRREAEPESDDEAVSPSAYLDIGDSGSDGEQSSRVGVPPPPPPRDLRAMNSKDACVSSLRNQERELSVNLRGPAARDYARGLSDGGSAAGGDNDVSSPWTFVALSELIVPQPPAAYQPAAAAAVRTQICRSCGRWNATTPRDPFTHICLCVTCRYNPSARIRCSVCGAGRRRSATGSP